MKLFHTMIFILLFIYISTYCLYDGKANQSFCSKRKVEASEIYDEYSYTKYVCCYLLAVVDGQRVEGCFPISPNLEEEYAICKTDSNTNSNSNSNSNSNTNSNTNSDSKGNNNGYKDDDDEEIFSFFNSNKYLLLKIYKIIIISILILY